MFKKALLIPVLLTIIAIASVGFLKMRGVNVYFSSFEECKRDSRSMILESYPEICVAFNGQRFTGPHEEPISLPPTSTKDPVITNIKSGDVVESPLTIEGTVPSGWMFEGSFPIEIIARDGQVITQGIAKETTSGSWMSDKPVVFKATLSFSTKNASGYIRLRNDNPSGLPENDKQFTLAVNFTSPQSSVESACVTSGGTWDGTYEECGGIGKEVCEKNGGHFNECASACRHNADKNAPCILLCVQTCEF